MSPASPWHLEYHHQHRSNTSTTCSRASTGDDDAAPNINIVNTTNSDGNDNNNDDDNILLILPYPCTTNQAAERQSIAVALPPSKARLSSCGATHARCCNTRKVIFRNIASNFQEVAN
uniref:Uncharacterized protein n=1 Tax=Oryza punctata TaxID=4537 RepID=A0A0E0L204_ORYPU